MDPIETLERINQTGKVPDSFWFLSTLILTSILIIFLGLITRYFYAFLKESSDYQKLTTANLTELKNMVGLMKKDLDYHREDIDKNSKDIDELKKRRR